MRSFAILAVLTVAACTPPTDNATAPANDSAATETNEAAAPAAVPDPAAAAGNAAVPAATPAKPEAAAEPYTARGQEPGWALTIAKGRIDYQGNYGGKRIEVTAPEPATTANGRRYVTERLTVAITYKRCNDAMSGHGYEHEVKVTADGESYDGCGGKRRTDWDM